MRELRQTMQDRDLDTDRLHEPPRVAPRTRYAAGEALDELGWLPEDLATPSGEVLDPWAYCPGCADGGGDLLALKYPVTNVQFERFIQAGGYNKPAYWGGERSMGWHGA